MNDYFTTYTGKRIYPKHLDEMEVDIIDIAHALSLNNRYNGHLEEGFSVAAHSLLVEKVSRKGLAALLHDANEAYLPDFASPWKSCYPEVFKEIEEKLDRIILAHFGIGYPLDPVIKDVDTRIRTDEMFFLSNWKDCTKIEFAFTHGIVADICRKVEPKIIEQEFLDRFEVLR